MVCDVTNEERNQIIVTKLLFVTVKDLDRLAFRQFHLAFKRFLLSKRPEGSLLKRNSRKKTVWLL